eukprot:6137589-Pyramimonas_sp.AAC.1
MAAPTIVRVPAPIQSLKKLWLDAVGPALHRPLQLPPIANSEELWKADRDELWAPMPKQVQLSAFFKTLPQSCVEGSSARPGCCVSEFANCVVGVAGVEVEIDGENDCVISIATSIG